VAVSGLWLLAAPTRAQDAEASLRSRFDWTDGAGRVELGSVGEIDLAEGYSFIGRSDTKRLMTLYGNHVDDTELGLVAPSDNLGAWFVVFEFDAVGYVPDDEKDELDPDALLEPYETGNKAENERREARGEPPFILKGWKTEPFYNEKTNNVEWCLHAESKGDPVFNHVIKYLGRRGVMDVTLVCGPEDFDRTLAETRRMLDGFSYQSGERYADWKEGDKIAEYGLTALVAGGALAVAAKTGLLQKLLKPLIIGAIAIGGAIMAFFKKLFGRGGANDAA